MSGILPEIRLLAAAIPLTTSDGAPPTAIPAGIRWNLVLTRSRREGVAPLLAWRLERERQIQILPDSIRKEFEASRLATAGRIIPLLQALRDIDESFAAAGISAVLFKGAALLETLYPDPGIRDMADADILVTPEDVPAARDALEQTGFLPVGWVPDGAPAADSIFNAALFRRGNFPAALHVHMHWRWSNASLPVASAPADAIPSSIPRPGFRALRIPVPEHHAVILAAHAFKHGFRKLIHLADLAGLWRKMNPAPAAVAMAAHRWGLNRAVGLALAITGEFYAVPDMRAAANRLEAGRPVPRIERTFRRRALARHRPTPRAFWLELTWRNSWRERMALLSRALFPPRDDIRRITGRDRPTGYGDYLRRIGRGLMDPRWYQ
ncbi:MAG: nucleotidyltransferase family protein [Planctomycetota bacterium]